jgi:hypothetical protein
MCGVVVASYPLLSQAPTPVEVELGCDNGFCSLKDFYLIAQIIRMMFTMSA